MSQKYFVNYETFIELYEKLQLNQKKHKFYINEQEVFNRLAEIHPTNSKNDGQLQYNIIKPPLYKNGMNWSMHSINQARKNIKLVMEISEEEQLYFSVFDILSLSLNGNFRYQENIKKVHLLLHPSKINEVPIDYIDYYDEIANNGVYYNVEIIDGNYKLDAIKKPKRKNKEEYFVNDPNYKIEYKDFMMHLILDNGYCYEENSKENILRRKLK